MKDYFKNIKANIFEKQCENMFDVQSNKKLDSILKHGYSFKHQEKKHYHAQRCPAGSRKANQEFLNATMQNKSMMSYIQNKPISRESSGNLSVSGQNLYAELFTDRYIKLTQSIMDSMPENDRNGSQIIQEEHTVGEKQVANEFDKAKKNRIYKELGMNINLKEIFQDMNYNDLMKLRKLHVLQAKQKIMQKNTVVPEEKKTESSTEKK